jgi:hypothetical protein
VLLFPGVRTLPEARASEGKHEQECRSCPAESRNQYGGPGGAG